MRLMCSCEARQLFPNETSFLILVTLFSDLIGLFEEKGWSWVDGGSRLGKCFLLKLRDALWYIDGHHAAFENCSLPIPEILKSFSGYNNPELSKHRKRKVGNTNYDVSISRVSHLKESLPTSWIQQERWRTLHEIIDELATSLDDYTTYLHQQSRTVKQKQDSLSVSDLGTVKHVATTITCGKFQKVLHLSQQQIPLPLPISLYLSLPPSPPTPPTHTHIHFSYIPSDDHLFCPF